MPRRDYAPAELIPGTVYRVLRPIASGGMGSVYEVEDTTVGKKYVLKTLLPALGDRQDLARRMAEEARVLARLAHPNIVEVITAGITGDDSRLPFYVMERLDGLNLRSLLEKKGALAPDRAIHIAGNLLDALGHAHDNGVIHRDVKPENIFLHRAQGGGTVTKLLDFGIMRMLDRGKETAGRFVGTLRYAAPEQLRGEKLGPTCDIYAAALVLYEMLAGRGPFDDEPDVHRAAAATLEKPAPPITTLVRVPEPLATLVMGALAKSPEDRPASAHAFAAALRAVVAGADAPVSDPTSRPRTSSPDDVRAPMSSISDQAAGMKTMAALETTSLDMAAHAGPGSSQGEAAQPTREWARPVAFGVALAVVMIGGVAAWRMGARSAAAPTAPPSAVSTASAAATATPTATAIATATPTPTATSTATATATSTATAIATATPTPTPTATHAAGSPASAPPAGARSGRGTSKRTPAAPSATGAAVPNVGPGF
jgi:serine/threonine protein kinase